MHLADENITLVPKIGIGRNDDGTARVCVRNHKELMPMDVDDFCRQVEEGLNTVFRLGPNHA